MRTATAGRGAGGGRGCWCCAARGGESAAVWVDSGRHGPLGGGDVECAGGELGGNADGSPRSEPMHVPAGHVQLEHAGE